MKILVPIRVVIDSNLPIETNIEQIDGDDAKLIKVIDPFCEVALATAVQLKDGGEATEVVVVTVGSFDIQPQLRSALALGADRALHIETSASLEPLTIAKLLNAVQEQECAELIILGKQSSDGDNNQTGQMLATLADLPLATFVSNIESVQEGIQTTCEIDGGQRILQLSLPAVITTELAIAQPKFAKLIDIIKAKNRPLTKVTPDELGIELTLHQKQLAILPVAPRSKGVKLNSVAELIETLF